MFDLMHRPRTAIQMLDAIDAFIGAPTIPVEAKYRLWYAITTLRAPDENHMNAPWGHDAAVALDTLRDMISEAQLWLYGGPR